MVINGATHSPLGSSARNPTQPKGPDGALWGPMDAHGAPRGPKDPTGIKSTRRTPIHLRKQTGTTIVNMIVRQEKSFTHTGYARTRFGIPGRFIAGGGAAGIDGFVRMISQSCVAFLCGPGAPAQTEKNDCGRRERPKGESNRTRKHGAGQWRYCPRLGRLQILTPTILSRGLRIPLRAKHLG